MEKQSQIHYIQVNTEKNLSPFIKCFWRFDNFSTKAYFSTILPDGSFDIIIKISDNSIQSISLTGLWTKPIDVSVAGNTTLFAIRFNPLSAECILQQQIAEIQNGNRFIENGFWGIDSLNLNDFEGFIKCISTKINSIIGSGKGIDHRKKELFALIYQSKGSIPIEEIANQICWSRRQINRYFNDRFGLSLKAYCNIIKVFESYKDIKKGQLYPQQNFYDQSHFIREIKKHTGTNPKELKKNKNDRFLQLYTMKDL